MTPEACARFFPEFPGFPCHKLILCFATGFLPGLTKITHSVSLYWDLTLVTQNRKSENFAESKFDEGDLKVAILDQLSIIFGDWALEPTGNISKFQF